MATNEVVGGVNANQTCLLRLGKHWTVSTVLLAGGAAKVTVPVHECYCLQLSA